MSEPITPDAVAAALAYADAKSKAPYHDGASSEVHQSEFKLRPFTGEGWCYYAAALNILASEVRRLRKVIASRDEDGREV